MSDAVTFCRRCEGGCGVIASVDGGVITSLRGDPAHPLSHGFLCEGAQASVDELHHPERIRTPLVRRGSGFEPVSWEEATAAIGEQLGKIRRSASARAVAINAGTPVALSGRDFGRTLAFALGMGTPNLTTTFAQTSAPWLVAVEAVCGAPIPLQADISRAHYTMLLGGNQRASMWGPMTAGVEHERGIDHQRKHYKGKLAVIDPRRTPLAEKADVHAPIRPGTDVFYLLGVLNAVVSGGWVDQQFLTDYTTGFEELAALVEPWTPERCAEICGIDRAAIAGVALKFARAPMATIKLGRGALLSEHATLTSWAALALCAVTANLLRPGGLFDDVGLLDPYPLLASLKTDGAPRSRVSGVPSVLLQLPSSVLAEEILTPGDGQVRALVNLCADPIHSAPSGGRMEEALASLDLLVCVDTFHNATTRLADWVLPAASFWERSDTNVHASATIHRKFAQFAEAAVEPVGQARPVDAILSELFRAARVPLRGGEWGTHLGLAGRFLATSDLDAWAGRIVDLLTDTEWEQVVAAEGGLDLGDVSRANWRVAFDDERVRLVPDSLRSLIEGLEVPGASDTVFLLGSRSRSESQPYVSAAEPSELTAELHPDALSRLGIEDGAAVRLVSGERVLVARAVEDAALRDDVVVIPDGWGVGIDLGGRDGSAATLAGAVRDPLTGAPKMSGCRIRIEVV